MFRTRCAVPATALLVACGAKPAPQAPRVNAEHPPTLRRTSEPAAGAAVGPDWSQFEPALATHLLSSRDRGDLDSGGTPCRFVIETLASERAGSIAVVRSHWSRDCADDPENLRIDAVHLLVERSGGVEVFPIARQFHAGEDAHIEPQVSDVSWKPGKPGPDLVLVVATASTQGTQCDPAVTDRRDLVVCDEDESGLVCAKLPIALEYYDGCGGAESYDETGNAELPPWEEPTPGCSRIRFNFEWEANPSGLELRPLQVESADCIDPSSTARWPGEVVAPLGGHVQYKTLFSSKRYQLEARRLRPTRG